MLSLDYSITSLQLLFKSIKSSLYYARPYYLFGLQPERLLLNKVHPLLFYSLQLHFPGIILRVQVNQQVVRIDAGTGWFFF